MNVHIGSWIVPLLFTLWLFGWYFGKLVRYLNSIPEARKTEPSPTDLAITGVWAFKFVTFSLVAWLVWALFGHPLQCGI